MKTEQLIEKLRKSGFKVTPQRLAIFEAILSSREHPTADQVYEKVRETHPTISPATVYQTLHTLSRIGLVQEMGFSDGVSRFDPDTSPHINVICLGCRRIEDYKAESFDKLWAQVIKELGFKPVGQRIDVYTHCDKCTRT
ncbi:transcriptional repressor [Candidatus Bathyarchaeota archaeon]|nr:transcriptional repressor [Candidatus Bathyarchaeota archaeon]